MKAKPEEKSNKLAALNTIANSPELAGGAKKKRATKPKAAKAAKAPKLRKQRGGAEFAPFPDQAAVFNTQYLLNTNNDPTNIVNDSRVNALYNIHAPFSTGAVGTGVQMPTADLPATVVGRITPGLGMAGGAKPKAAKAPAKAKQAKAPAKKK